MTNRRYSVTLTDPFQKGLDTLIEMGLFIDDQHAIREGLRCIFERYEVKPFCTHARKDT